MRVFCVFVQSVVTFEVKPWDDETDMAKLEESVRSIEMEGLVWGASKLVPVGYGVKKLQITLVVGMLHNLIFIPVRYSLISNYLCRGRTCFSR